MRHRATVGIVVGLVLVLADAVSVAAQGCRAPRALVDTPLGIKYCADPALDAAIDAAVKKIRQDVRAARQNGRLVIYMSTAISPRGGGVQKVNLEIAEAVKTRLEKTFGAGVWVLNPGVYQLSTVADKTPGGGDYMVMWARVLGGDDGMGRDVDMVHFTGPGDMRAFFGCGPEDLTGCLSRWLTARGAADPELRGRADNAEARRDFVRYYSLRASAAYSSGARDEWNIFVRINRRRPLGEQIAMFFDGRPASPVEMETEIAPGYEIR